MPPTHNRSASDAYATGSQNGVPQAVEDLRRRSRHFLSGVGATMDAIETLLGSWTRLGEASASSTGAPENNSFQRVQLDVFTVREPPPRVTEAEICQYIRRLSKQDLKALEDEYELTCVDDFEYVHSGDDGASTATQTAAPIVHFSEAVADVNDGDTSSGVATHQPTPPPAHFLSVSPTTHARALFESDSASLDRLALNSMGRVAVVRPPHAPAAESRSPPAFSLEQMLPSTIATQERRRRSASPASSNSSAPVQAPAAAGLDATTSYTVEINYSADHFFPSTVQRALRDKAGSAIMVNPGTHPAVQHQEARAVVASRFEAAAPLLFGSDTEVSEAEEDVQSFSTFSRMVLANEGRRLTSQRAHPEAPASAETDTQPPSSVRGDRLPLRGVTESQPPPAAVPAPVHVAPAKAVKVNGTRTTRDAFVRQRVHDILLANRIRADDATTLGAAFFEKLDQGWKAAANQTTPVLHKLDDALCEATVLLHTLEVMDHQAYRMRVTDPTQYLCVPRYAAVCAAPDCSTAFSATTTRVMCGRCGQPFCPTCCAERGLGPDVVCDGQRYSLGWEPLCRLCFQMCRESQRTLVRLRRETPRITDVEAAACSTAESEDAAEEAACRASLDSLTVKQAVLFGAYCDKERCLSDGLPPFYVMDDVANEGVVFRDVLQYRLAKTKGKLRRGWQSAGRMAANAMQSAAQMMNLRSKLSLT